MEDVGTTDHTDFSARDFRTESFLTFIFHHPASRPRVPEGAEIFQVPRNSINSVASGTLARERGR
ncbi:MAG: hypothetical protein DMF00_08000 [Verrucomicrobia bacterium]|nr:MAG: hypothetical protein DMF00_08000 [Verrucomicrobiota bacterium]